MIDFIIFLIANNPLPQCPTINNSTLGKRKDFKCESEKWNIWYFIWIVYSGVISWSNYSSYCIILFINFIIWKAFFYCKSIQQKFLKPQNVLKKWLSSSKLVGTSSKRSLEVCFRSILLWLYMNILLFNGNTFFQLFRDIKFYYSTNQHGTILEVKQILVLALAAEKKMYQLGGRKSFECLSQKP